MEKRTIGSLQVSVVGLGCNNFGWRIDEWGTAAVVDAAIAAGINFFDTADIYGGTLSEEFLGRALGNRRNDVIVATKFGMKVDDQKHGAKPDYIHRAVEDSLRRLGTDRIDLYQLHRPDPTTPIADTLGALDELVKAGKVVEIGCSNFSVEQLQEAKRVTRPGAAKFVSVQNELNLIRRDAAADVIPECEREELAFLPFFPLASGLLTGKYRKGKPTPGQTRLGDGSRYADLLDEKNLNVVEGLIAYAESHNHTILELSFGWLLAHRPVASVIAGATSEKQVQSNADAANWKLSEEDMKAIDKIVTQS